MNKRRPNVPHGDTADGRPARNASFGDLFLSQRHPPMTVEQRSENAVRRIFEAVDADREAEMN